MGINTSAPRHPSLTRRASTVSNAAEYSSVSALLTLSVFFLSGIKHSHSQEPSIRSSVNQTLTRRDPFWKRIFGQRYNLSKIQRHRFKNNQIHSRDNAKFLRNSFGGGRVWMKSGEGILRDCVRSMRLGGRTLLLRCVRNQAYHTLRQLSRRSPRRLV